MAVDFVADEVARATENKERMEAIESCGQEVEKLSELHSQSDTDPLQMARLSPAQLTVAAEIKAAVERTEAERTVAEQLVESTREETKGALAALKSEANGLEGGLEGELQKILKAQVEKVDHRRRMVELIESGGSIESVLESATAEEPQPLSGRDIQQMGQKQKAEKWDEIRTDKIQRLAAGATEAAEELMKQRPQHHEAVRKKRDVLKELDQMAARADSCRKAANDAVSRQQKHLKTEEEKAKKCKAARAKAMDKGKELLDKAREQTQALQKTMRKLADNRCEQNGHYGHEKRLEASCAAAAADLEAAEEAKALAIQACEACKKQVELSRKQVAKDLQEAEDELRTVAPLQGFMENVMVSRGLLTCSRNDNMAEIRYRQQELESLQSEIQGLQVRKGKQATLELSFKKSEMEKDQKRIEELVEEQASLTKSIERAQGLYDLYRELHQQDDALHQEVCAFAEAKVKECYGSLDLWVPDEKADDVPQEAAPASKNALQKRSDHDTWMEEFQRKMNQRLEEVMMDARLEKEAMAEKLEDLENKMEDIKVQNKDLQDELNKALQAQSSDLALQAQSSDLALQAQSSDLDSDYGFENVSKPEIVKEQEDEREAKDEDESSGQ